MHASALLVFLPLALAASIPQKAKPFNMTLGPYDTAACEMRAAMIPGASGNATKVPLTALVEEHCFNAPFEFGSYFEHVSQDQQYRLDDSNGGCQLTFFDGASCTMSNKSMKTESIQVVPGPQCNILSRSAKSVVATCGIPSTA